MSAMNEIVGITVTDPDGTTKTEFMNAMDAAKNIQSRLDAAFVEHTCFLNPNRLKCDEFVSVISDIAIGVGYLDNTVDPKQTRIIPVHSGEFYLRDRDADAFCKLYDEKIFHFIRTHPDDWEDILRKAMGGKNTSASEPKRVFAVHITTGALEDIYDCIADRTVHMSREKAVARMEELIAEHNKELEEARRKANEVWDAYERGERPMPRWYGCVNPSRELYVDQQVHFADNYFVCWIEPLLLED